jgi:hypothetical protein
VNVPLARPGVEPGDGMESRPRDVTPTAGPVRAGFRRDRTHRIAAQLAWLLTLLVALASVWPAWSWWSASLELLPRGDVLIDRVDLVALKELVQFDRGSTFGMVNAAMVAGAVLALLLNPLIGGGVIGLLTGGAGASRVSQRFFETGARFYGRFLRALIYVGLAAALVAGLWWGLGIAVGDALSERGLERAQVAAYALRLAGIGLIAAFFTAVLDLARIRIAAGDSRYVLVACADALRLALRRLGDLLRIAAVFLFLLLAVAAVAFTIRASLPGGGWGWLIVAFALQQAVAYARLRLRVASMAALVVLTRPQARAASVLEAPFAEYDSGEGFS